MIRRTNSTNEDFIQLVSVLDKELAIRDGDDHDYYHQFNSIEELNHVVLLYQDEKAVSCGAIKHFEENSMEIKRMFTLLDYRGTGYGSMILKELETWAKEIGVKNLILETGRKMPEAIGMYTKLGYEKIPNYGQYVNMPESVCFKKEL